MSLPSNKFFIVIALIVSFCHAMYGADRKTALIIGNGEYQDVKFGQLATPENDATEVNSALLSLGYETILLLNGSREEILTAIHEFESKLKSSDVGVFYYSGHGVRIGSEQYLVPSKSALHMETLSDECIRLRNIQAMLKKNCSLSFLFIDACRNDVGSQAMESGSDKAIKVPTQSMSDAFEDNRPVGQMIFYATESGSTASTGKGRLSPFTEVLVRHLYDTEEFRSIVPVIESDVNVICGQTPVIEGSYTNNWYFNASEASRPEWTTKPLSTVKHNASRQNEWWKSAILPGYAQWCYGSKGKALAFASSELVSIAGIAYCGSMSSAYNRKAVEQPKYAKEYYSRADNWAMGRNICIGVAAGVWLINVADAAFSQDRGSKHKGCRVEPVVVNNQYGGLQLTYTF